MHRPRYTYIIDVETTGLDPYRHGILEATFIRVEIRNEDSLTPGPLHYDAPIQVNFPLAVIGDDRNQWEEEFLFAELDPEAQKVNGYTKEDLKAHEIPLVNWIAKNWSFYKNLVDGSSFIGANVAFDVNFLMAFNARVRDKFPTLDIPEPHYKHTDIEAMGAQALRGAFYLPPLAHLCAMYGVTNQSPHTSMGDAITVRDVLIALLDEQARVDRLSSQSVTQKD